MKMDHMVKPSMYINKEASIHLVRLETSKCIS